MSEDRTVRVVVVDDVPELRLLVRLTLEEDPAIEVVGEASNGRESRSSSAPIPISCCSICQCRTWTGSRRFR
jgi:DNA-binding NarL/FixJ family response regulator